MIRANTSSSNFFRRVLCAGSASEEAKYDSVDSDYSQEGRMLHELFLTMNRPNTLTADQVQVLDDADRLAFVFIENFMRENGIDDEAEFHDSREITMDFKHPTTGLPLFPGHADVIRHWPRHGMRVVLDFKSGFMEVDHAADNWQLAIYAVQAHQRDPMAKTGVAVIQPRNFGPKISTAAYEAAELERAALAVLGYFEASEKKNAPLVPGEAQCHYCKAKAGCPAYTAQFDAMSLAVTTAVGALDAGSLEKVFRAIKFAKKIDDEVSDEMRKRVEAGTMPGWKLRNTGDVTKLTKPLDFLKALQRELGADKITALDFDGCRGMVWGELETVIATKCGLSEKRAKEVMKTLQEGCVTRTPKTKAVVEDKAK